jgi:hypothetical protein
MYFRLFFFFCMLSWASSSLTAQCNQQLYLDGAEAVVMLDPVQLSGDFTIECWFRSEGLLTRDAHLLGGNYQEVNFNGGRASLMYADNQYAISSTVLVPNLWYHLAIVREGNSMRLYLNGSLNASQTTVWSGDFVVRMMGRSLFENFGYQGFIDEIRFWRDARSLAEVSANYQKALARTHPDFGDLIAYFKCNRADELLLEDLAGNHIAYLPTPDSRRDSVISNFVDTCQHAPVAQPFSVDAQGSCVADIPFLAHVSDLDGPLEEKDVILMTPPSFGKVGSQRNDSVILTLTISPSPTTLDVDIAELKYDKAFAYTFTIDDAHRSALTTVFPYLNGSGTNPGKYFTDGCGNDIPFRCDLAWNTANSYYQDIHLNSNQVSWPELVSLYQAGWGVMNHAFAHGALEVDMGVEGEVVKNQNYVWAITSALGEPVQMRHFVVPSNWFEYGDTALYLGLRSTHSQGGPGYLGGPPHGHRVDGQAPLDSLKMDRDYKKGSDNVTTLMQELNQTAAQSVAGKKHWYNDFIHGIKNVNGGWAVYQSEFYQFMDQVESQYGKFGSDNIWFASIEEIYDYLLLKQQAKLSFELNGNQLKIIVDMNDLPQDLRFYDLSLVLTSPGSIQSLNAQGVSQFSYQASGRTKLINISLDHSNTALLQQYQKNKVGSTNDALIYQVKDADGNLSNPATVTINNLCPDNQVILDVGPLELAVKQEPSGHRISWLGLEESAGKLSLERAYEQGDFETLLAEASREGCVHWENSPPEGSYRYRLRWEQADQAVQYSQVIELYEVGKPLQLRADPGKSLELWITEKPVGPVSIRLLDLTGKELCQWQVEATAGKHQLELKKNLPSGVYAYQLRYHHASKGYRSDEGLIRW